MCVQHMTNGANHDSQCKTTKSCHSEFIQPWAAQKPNRLELEDAGLVGLVNLLLGILLGAFDILAGPYRSVGEGERS